MIYRTKFFFFFWCLTEYCLFLSSFIKIFNYDPKGDTVLQNVALQYSQGNNYGTRSGGGHVTRQFLPRILAEEAEPVHAFIITPIHVLVFMDTKPVSIHRAAIQAGYKVWRQKKWWH